MTENWKKIVMDAVEYSNYEVSDLGRIRNYRHQILTPNENADGYMKCIIRIGKTAKTFLVHHIVAHMFLPNPKNRLYISHIKDRKDNRVVNLEWTDDTQEERRSTHSKRITLYELDCITPVTTYNSIQEAATDLNIEYKNIYPVLCGIIKYTAKKYHFKYADPQEVVTDEELKEFEEIKLHPNYMVHRDGRVYNKKYKLVMGGRECGGYLYVILDGISYGIHRLIATQFLPNPNNEEHVYHIENKLNNHVNNLVWMSKSQHLCDIELNKNITPVNQYKLDGTFIAQYESIADACRILEIDSKIYYSIITDCCARRIKNAYDSIWRYVTDTDGIGPLSLNNGKKKVIQQTEKKNRIENKISTLRFREKQKKAFIECGEDLTQMPTKANCRWKMIDDEILCFMTCANCNVSKERTTENYVACNVNRDIENWFTSSKAGHENLSNSKHKPCIPCYTEKIRQLHSTDSSAYFKHLCSTYDNISYNDIINLWNNTTHGYITGIPKKYMQPFRSHDLAPGIHDLERNHWTNSTKYSSSEHVIEHVCLDLVISNVAQNGKIPDLRLAYIEVYTDEVNRRMSTTVQEEDEDECIRIQEWFNKTPTENGVTTRNRKNQTEYQAQRRKFDLNFILGSMIGDHNKTDKQKSRKGIVPKKSVEYLNVLVNYKMRCAVSGMRLTVKENKFTDLSFDRIDNNRSHAIDNIRPVCVLFQVAGKKHLSHKQYLHMCLLQVHVVISDDMRVQIRSEHDTLDEYCAFCLLDTK